MEQVMQNTSGETAVQKTGEETAYDRVKISLRKGDPPNYLTEDSVINGVPVDIRDFAYTTTKGVYLVSKCLKDGVLDKYHFKNKEMYDIYAAIVLQVAFS